MEKLIRKQMYDWSYIVTMYDGYAIQVDCDTVEIANGGAYVFSRCSYEGGVGNHVLLILPGASVKRCCIMSQASGNENGYRTLDAS